MRWRTKTVRSITDAAGFVSYGDGPEIPVRFDLKETEDALNEGKDLNLGLGNLRYGAEFRQVVLGLVRSGAPLTLRGDVVEVAIILFGANKFTVIKRG